MIIKKNKDHILVNTPTCGELHEILTNQDYKSLGIAVAIDIKETLGHFHKTFDEIYFVLDGQISLDLYDPSTQSLSSCELKKNELCVITKGIHHKITSASSHNRLCVISTPPFHSDDEHPSDKL